PMGSMTGAPKFSAMKLIDRYERMARGLYSGSVGYITPEMDFDFNVVIRSFLYNQQSGYLSYSVGSAITDACDASNEYDECLLKANALRGVFNKRVEKHGSVAG
ncbi:MAG: chorismate-binding protein, partial [Marinilabiliaceae bacterium]